MDKESSVKTFSSVMLLALICSLLVAGAAVGLRPKQEANQKLDQKKNILRAAGLYQGKGDVEILFQQIDTKIIRLADGGFVAPEQIDPASFEQLKAALTSQGRELDKKQDLASLGRQEKYSLVYLVNKDGQLDKVILPIRGKGLWSTMYGYVALNADLSTISGITFYQHGETPGLGGEIENPSWQAGWVDKKIYNPDGKAIIRVVKGKATSTGEENRYQVDGVSGATLTMKGVSNLMTFWFGEHGFAPFLQRQREGRKDG